MLVSYPFHTYSQVKSTSNSKYEIPDFFFNQDLLWTKSRSMWIVEYSIHFEKWISPPPKKKKLCCPHPTKIWKLGRSVDFFFFFLRTVRELSFSNIFFKVSKWGKRGRKAVKTHIWVIPWSWGSVHVASWYLKNTFQHNSILIMLYIYCL